MNTTSTPAAYDLGRTAARETARSLCEPNWAMIARQPAAFEFGFRYEWTQYVLPARAFQAAVTA